MEDGFLRAVHDDPADPIHWLVLADWLEDSGQPDRAALVRLREGLRTASEDPGRATHERAMQRLLLEGTLPPVPHWRIPLSGEVAVELALVPSGSFWMGSQETEPHRFENESPRHLVTISKPFYLATVPVTQAQWRAVMGSDPSKFAGEQHPVESVSWPECQEFCDRLSALVGRTCRLPYEAEWEYACRAGTSSAFNLGDSPQAMRKAGWCSHRAKTGSARRTRPVARYLPNAFGLYDMHGNVREWCQDDLRRYTRKPQTDPRGPEVGTYRVVRGGSWYYAAEDSRAACRYSRPVDYHLDYYGFRVLVTCG